MGFDLTSDSGEEFSFSNSGWRYLMEIASAHGFQWPTDSNGDETDRLDSVESAALANALETAIGSDSASEIAQRLSTLMSDLHVTLSNSQFFSANPIKFEARTVHHWREFILFARTGGFSISF